MMLEGKDLLYVFLLVKCNIAVAALGVPHCADGICMFVGVTFPKLSSTHLAHLSMVSSVPATVMSSACLA
eukprot:184811-Pyramimonas_sp.AAC.1